MPVPAAFFQHGTDRVRNLVCRLDKGTSDFVGGNRNRRRKSGDDVSSLDLHRFLLGPRISGTNPDFHCLCGLFSDKYVVCFPYIADDILVKCLTGNLDRIRNNGSASEITAISVVLRRCPRSYSAWFRNVNSGSDCRCHRLRHDQHFPAPAWYVASSTAFRSTSVTPDGTQMLILGFRNALLPIAFWIK